MAKATDDFGELRAREENFDFEPNKDNVAAEIAEVSIKDDGEKKSEDDEESKSVDKEESKTHQDHAESKTECNVEDHDSPFEQGSLRFFFFFFLASFFFPMHAIRFWNFDSFIFNFLSQISFLNFQYLYSGNLEKIFIFQFHNFLPEINHFCSFHKIQKKKNKSHKMIA